MDIDTLLNIFSLELKNSKRPFLFHDSDCDGSYSYFQLKKANKNLRGTSISKSRSVQIRMFEEHVMEENDVIFFFDTPHIEEDLIKELQTQVPDRKILIVDHHENKLQELADKYDLIYFNPLNFDKKDSRPSCFWANKITNLEENLVPMVIGSIADFFLLDVVDDLEKKDKKIFNFLFNLPEQKQKELLSFVKKYNFNDDLVQEERAKMIQMIWYETNLGKIRALVDFLYKLKSEHHKDALSIIEKTPIDELVISIDAGQGFLFEDFYLFRKKQKKLIEKALEKNRGKEFVIFEHRGKTSYNRQLSEELLYRIPETKVMWLIFKKMDSDWTSCSFRARFPYVINTAISDSLEGLKGQGGGHPQSGGCAVAISDFEEFKTRFVKKIEEQF